jgi:serine/threonine protein kinase
MVETTLHFKKENVEQLIELISIVDIKRPIADNFKDFVSKAEEFRVEAESKFRGLLKKLDKAADEVFNAYSENPRDINNDKPEDRQMYDEYMTQDGFFRYLNSMLPQNKDEPYEIYRKRLAKWCEKTAIELLQEAQLLIKPQFLHFKLDTVLFLRVGILELVFDSNINWKCFDNTFGSDHRYLVLRYLLLFNMFINLSDAPVQKKNFRYSEYNDLIFLLQNKNKTKLGIYSNAKPITNPKKGNFISKKADSEGLEKDRLVMYSLYFKEIHLLKTYYSQGDSSEYHIVVSRLISGIGKYPPLTGVKPLGMTTPLCYRDNPNHIFNRGSNFTEADRSMYFNSYCLDTLIGKQVMGDFGMSAEFIDIHAESVQYTVEQEYVAISGLAQGTFEANLTAKQIVPDFTISCKIGSSESEQSNITIEPIVVEVEKTKGLLAIIRITIFFLEERRKSRLPFHQTFDEVEIYENALLRYLESSGFEIHSEEIMKAEDGLKKLKGLIKYGMGILDQTIKQILESYASAAILTNGDDAVFINFFEERAPDNVSILQNGIISILQHSRIDYHSVFDKVRLPVKVEAFVKSVAIRLMSNSSGQLNELQETERKRNIKDLNMLHMSNYSTKLRLILQREVVIDSIITHHLTENYDRFKKAETIDSNHIVASLSLGEPNFKSNFKIFKERALEDRFLTILMESFKDTLELIGESKEFSLFDILFLSEFQTKYTHLHTIKGSKPPTLDFSTVFQVDYADKVYETSVFKVFDPSRNKINPDWCLNFDKLQIASILGCQFFSKDSDSDITQALERLLLDGEGPETIKMRLNIINSISISLLQVLDELYCYSHLWHCYPRNEFIPHVRSHGFIFNDLFSLLSCNKLALEMFCTSMPLIEGFYLELEDFEDVHHDVLRSLDNDTKKKAFKDSFKILCKIHQAGILHNDLTENNVLLSIKNEEMFVRIIDFSNSIIIYNPKAESKLAGITSESSAGWKRRRLNSNHMMNIINFLKDEKTAEPLIDLLKKDYDALREAMEVKLNFFEEVYDDAKIEKLAREDYAYLKAQPPTGSPVEISEI